MGGALIRGWHKAATEGRASLAIMATAHTDRTLETIAVECCGVEVTRSNAQAASWADVLVLAVKPWVLPEVAAEVQEALACRTEKPVVISVVANVTTIEIDKMMGPDVPCIYAMPNIAAAYGASMTFADAEADSQAVERARELFALVGQVELVAPRLMAPGMMMAGCGIAYVMRFVRAMMEGGVEMGFYPHQAQHIALQTMEGAVQLLQQTGQHPEAAIDRVTTPGGITIRGLNELEHSGFTSAVIRCLKAGL